MPKRDHFETGILRAQEALKRVRGDAGQEASLTVVYREFLKQERAAVRESHQAGAGGVEIAKWRAAIMDVLLNDLFVHARDETKAIARTKTDYPVTLVASGGYGRGELNPGSDIDLQFLIPGTSKTPSKAVAEMVGQISTVLFDLGFDVSYPVRTLKGAIKFANEDHHTKTTLLDARFIAGDGTMFDEFEETFFKHCIREQETAYLRERSLDIRSRHKKYGKTIHLQEPNVKEGCGGLRDYHNLIWVLWVLRKSRDLSALVAEDRLTSLAFKEIKRSYEFLMRVRNELHYCQKGSPSDVLTLRLQGIVATGFQYPEKTILRRSESFMRDYYRHTRNLFQHSTSLMQSFELEVSSGDETERVPILNFLARSKAPGKLKKFDGFIEKNGLIYPETEAIFEEDPKRMMRFFLHSQTRHLSTSPEIRRLFKRHWSQIDGNFRKSKSNRETFKSILRNRGQVATILRRMHRVGFLGRYIPEFEPLTDLVQHEFFHRYSADEHTLRCIDMIDGLIHSDDPKEQFFKRIFQDMEDPVAMYSALLMHDTGRAENVRHHEDASAILASSLCRRMRFHGDRLRLIMFLVDHHLTFWRTATTNDIADPETIANFASTVRYKSWMEALYLFSYVDSKGTNEDAWNDWKASLMRQLYESTKAYFEDREGFDRKFRRPIADTKAAVIKKLPENYLEEIDAHFQMMPDRYFSNPSPTSISRHIKHFHKFFKVLKRNTLESLTPIMHWEARPDEGYSLIEVAGWNRHHLLAKIAGAFAARNLNILSADLYARKDDLVLDVFRVCTPRFTPVRSEKEIERIRKLMEKEFSVGEGEVDFQTLITKQAAPSILEAAPLEVEIPERVYFSNDLNAGATVLEIQAEDRIGLLYDIFTILGNHDAEVLHSRISTQAGAAIDRFYLVGTHTGKKIEPSEFSKITKELSKCLRSSKKAKAKASAAE